MNIRTDLVTETKQEIKKDIHGVQSSEESIGNANLSTIKITSDTAGNMLQKPIGTYCTVSFPRLDFMCDTGDLISATVKAIKTVFDHSFKSALVVGLGNTDITPDALGPFVCDRVLATRHLSDKLKQDLGLTALKSVCGLTPNVLGKTGIESYDLISAAVKKTSPDIIIAVDALACRSPERLCKTIQISNSGITAGSGVNNARKTLNRQNIGVPVIAIGVPTVIDGNSYLNTT